MTEATVIRRAPKGSRHGEEQGQVLALVLVFLGFALLLLPSISLFVTTASLTEAAVATEEEKYYAAAAGIERVLADLIRGADAVPMTYTNSVSTSYTVPSVTLNELTPVITVSEATGAKPAGKQQYVDPGVTDPALHVLPAGKGYLSHLYYVQGSATITGTLEINIAYDPAANIRIGVWRDVIADDAPGTISSFPPDSPLDRQNSGGSASFVHAGPLTIDTTGIYSFAVFNISDPPVNVTIRPFKPSGGTGDSWIFVSAFRDYIITSTVDDVTVRAYVRQTPGFVEPPPRPARSGAVQWVNTNISWITHTLNMYTWERP